GSFPSNPSRNFHADAVTRSWRNKERSRAFTSRNDDAQTSSVVSTDAPAIHDPPNHGGPWIQKSKENATVMLGTYSAPILAAWFFRDAHRLSSNKQTRGLAAGPAPSQSYAFHNS